jgi:flagellar biosynthesis/type III secretory pathway M-ring protein FliF/YscJ
MVWQEWIPVAVGVIAILTAVGAAIRYVIKNYLRQELHVIKHELQPNSGSSMKDQVTRLEANQQHITETQKSDSERFDSKLDKLEDKVDKMFEIILKHFGNS